MRLAATTAAARDTIRSSGRFRMRRGDVPSRGAPTASGLAVPVGGLLRERRHMTEQELKVVGQSVLRRDGLGHVTGQTKYVDDIFYPGMLHLKMVRSPVPHARIRSDGFLRSGEGAGVCAGIDPQGCAQEYLHDPRA